MIFSVDTSQYVAYLGDEFAGTNSHVQARKYGATDLCQQIENPPLRGRRGVSPGGRTENIPCPHQEGFCFRVFQLFDLLMFLRKTQR
ncbi:MAG: hypothetical protein B6245_16190 [Desulfobacteraceae bacterium 4572_88]|nr:MAG: hypothetical protein B6245_16190 [Desulfobacteraceae bacterium 4572_88]